jgi:hypothetical protein
MTKTRPGDGGRMRCASCGHPKKEHNVEGCTVRRCPCAEHMAKTKSK